jgi:hypothetical protein
MKFRNNKEIESEIHAPSTPESGARGTNCGPDETLQNGRAHETQTEFDAKESTTQSAKKSANQQIYGTPEGLVEGAGNPKHRLDTSGIRSAKSEGK